jgi:hypothetical protein
MVAEIVGQEIPAQKAVGEETLVSKIEPSKIIDLIVSKQTQYYTLWAVYTAVQFAAGSFALNLSPVPLWVGLFVFFGVWAFNFGHLGFVLQCVSQLEKLSEVLKFVLQNKKEQYISELNVAFEKMEEGAYFWHFLGSGEHLRSYRMNMFVHFFIDTCASAALLFRLDWASLPSHIPSFLRVRLKT